MSEIEFDLGDYGVLLVEPSEVEGVLAASPWGEKVKAKVQDVLGRPLAGFSKALADSIPDSDLNSAYHLEEFTVEFEVGISAEFGKDGALDGIVAKVLPKGTFKCVYHWKRTQAQ